MLRHLLVANAILCSLLFPGSTNILRAIIPLYIVMSLSQFMPPMLTVIVDEKEKKIKESMRMVGLRDSVFWEVRFKAVFDTLNE